MAPEPTQPQPPGPTPPSTLSSPPGFLNEGGPEGNAPTDEQLTGGRGDNLQETVQRERTGTTEGSVTEEPRNRMIAENQVDLDALADTGPNRQGNAYGVSQTAAENFAKDFRNKAKLTRQEADRLDEQAEEWEQRASELGENYEETKDEQQRETSPDNEPTPDEN